MGKRKKKKCALYMFEEEITKVNNFCAKRNIAKNDLYRVAILNVVDYLENYETYQEKYKEAYENKEALEVISNTLANILVETRGVPRENAVGVAQTLVNTSVVLGELNEQISKLEQSAPSHSDIKMTESKKEEIREQLEQIKIMLKKQRQL